MAICHNCDGTGSITSSGDETCHSCGGRGYGGHTNQACGACGGSGRSNRRAVQSCGFCGGSGRRADSGLSGANATRSTGKGGTTVSSEKKSNGIPQFAFVVSALFTIFVLYLLNEDGGLSGESAIGTGVMTFVVSFVAVIICCYLLLAAIEMLKFLIGLAIVLFIIAIIIYSVSDARAIEYGLDIRGFSSTRALATQ